MQDLSFSQLLKLYTAYNFGGKKAAGALLSSLLADKVIASKFGYTKHYVSLSGFWGYMAYKAISQTMESNKIDLKYKPLLYILFSGVSAGMVLLGKDIFADKHDANTTFKSIGLAAKFVDQKGIIDGLENAYKESYLKGINYTVKNVQDILSNKFIMNALIKQSLEVAKLFLMEKFFHAAPFDKISILLSIKNEDSLNKIGKLAFVAFAKQIINLGHREFEYSLDRKLKQDMDIEIANIAFQDSNTQTIMKLNGINQISFQMSSVYNSASSDMSGIIGEILMPFISAKNSSGEAEVRKIFNDYPSLFLINGLIQTIFSYSNIAKLDSLIQKVFAIKASNKAEEYNEVVSNKIGQFTLNQNINSESYAYNNIQEIAKLGGQKFILDKLVKYIENAKYAEKQVGQNIGMIMLNLFKDIVHLVSYASQIAALNIGSEQIALIEYNINQASNILGINDLNNLINPQNDLEQLCRTLDALERKCSQDAKRHVGEDMKLLISNYHIKKSTENKDMLSIPKLEFIPGNIYAINGSIGTGKTTFLNDIAGCLSNNFNSNGDIYYPSHNGVKVPQIFCGTMSFSPPKTTLFEKLTYRLPVDYRDANKEGLIVDILNLFSDFGQKFTKESLETKGNNDALGLSTGQSKLCILISAILYKQYLKNPVLFVIDETLANLDSDTTNSVCKKIKSVFQDSIVISVDHQAKSNGAFYQNFINLEEFKPQELVGQGFDELMIQH